MFVHIGGNGMKNKLILVLVLLLTAAALPLSASAELALKPVADPWDDPNNLIKDGQTYTSFNEDGYIVAWETPECNLNGKYMLIKNDTELKVEYRVSYMGDVPWGHVTVAADGGESFTGWVLMSDLLGADGKPAAQAPVKVPDHPMIADPKPEPTEEPENPEATPTPTVPVRPEQAISINNTYNAAIVYTSAAIAAAAIAFAVLVLVKHKALNKKGE